MTKQSPIWHPFTQHGLKVPEIQIDRAQGAYLYRPDGRKILDAISSWWVITHGHCHPKIAAAVQAQAEKLDQVIFAGFTHEPAEKLAEKLLSISAPIHEHVFFSDSGSTAVEVALKMTIGYFAQTGRERKTIVALEGGYHGDTFGTMSAGARGVFSKVYEPFLFDVKHLPFPGQGHEMVALERFEEILKGGDVAALIVEPLVQGAGGMRIYAPSVLKAMADLCQRYDALLIADEVMTGFGRTGTRFACEQAGVIPDLVCLSKGLTGGFLPMGVTLATKEIYDAFYDTDKAKMFFHSSSFTGNPLACAGALANLGLWDEEPVMERLRMIGQSHQVQLERFNAHDDVRNVRALGTIFALDIEDENDGYLSDVAGHLYQFYVDQGVLLRPLGNTVYCLPPYCVTREDLDKTYEVIWDSLDTLQSRRS